MVFFLPPVLEYLLVKKKRYQADILVIFPIIITVIFRYGSYVINMPGYEFFYSFLEPPPPSRGVPIMLFLGEDSVGVKNELTPPEPQ